MEHIRSLTEEEIAQFPGDCSVNVALRAPNGVWYYADGYPTEDDPSGFEDAQCVLDEDGEYIPIE